jgi:hypothetical protein
MIPRGRRLTTEKFEETRITNDKHFQDMCGLELVTSASFLLPSPDIALSDRLSKVTCQLPVVVCKSMGKHRTTADGI